MQLGCVDPPLGDASVDPLAVCVHPRPCGPSGPPVGTSLATEVATHRLPRHVEFSGDLSDRHPLPTEFMDPLEPLDTPLSLGERGFLSR